MCADDGSPTSLVSEPLLLPKSPYKTPIPSTMLFNKGLDHGQSVVNLV